mgnify:CR=1 FL=1
MKFLDQAKIYIKAGNGGSGSASFRREKYVEFGGPDGGDGGDGGSVILKSERNLNTLIDFRYKQHFKAEVGKSGSKKNKTGAGGKDLILKVPVGTQIYEEDNNTLIFDFTKNNEKFIVATGGKGGLGNTRFKSSTNRAPRIKTNGKKGEEFWIWLQLKVIADIGIIGLPNAGKSSFLSKCTRAKPKIASYPFTTINPNLGVLNMNHKEIILADIPGLIEGAHRGAGIGHRFLGHVERCRVLLHLIDVTHSDPIENWHTVRTELSAYDQNLANKPEIVALSKCDSAPEDYITDLIEMLQKTGVSNIFRLSSVSGNGINEVLRAINDVIQSERIEADNLGKIQKPWHP